MSQYVDDLLRGGNRLEVLAGTSSPISYFPNAIVSRQTIAIGSQTHFVNLNTGLPDLSLDLNYLPSNVIIDQMNFNGQHITNPSIHAPGPNGCVPASCAMIIDSINVQKEANGMRVILSPSQGQYAQIDNFAGTIGYNTSTDTNIINVPPGIFQNTHRPLMVTAIMPNNLNLRANDILEFSQNGPILLEIRTEIHGLHAVVVDAVGSIDSSGVIWAAVRDPSGYEYLVPLDDLAQRATRLGYYNQPITN